MTTPGDLLYTKEHEWVRVEEETFTIGITDHAQEQLGDVVYVELPSAGEKFEANDAFGTVESVKAVSELFMPVSGEVVAVNQSLVDAPESVNDDPYGSGWMIRIRPADPEATGDLLSADDYDTHVSGSDEDE